MRFVAPSRYEQFKTSGQLPSQKGVALGIMSLLQRDYYEFDDLVQLIQSDPVISGQLLKICNSAVYGRSRPVVSLARAIVALGASRVGVLVLGLSLLQSYRSGKCPRFDYQRFWSRALATAISAQALATYAKVAGEENFTAGLLCNIGELALASIFPERYGEIIAASSSVAERIALEQKTFDTDHRELAATMLREWRLPDVLVAGVYHSEIPDEAGFADGSRSFIVTHSLHISLALADICVAKEAERWKMVPNLFVKAARLGIGSEVLTSLADSIFSGWREWGKMLEVQTHEIPPFANLLSSPPPKKIGSTSASSATPKNYSVLVICASLSEVSEITGYLEADGYSVQSSSNVAEGLDIALRDTPEIILLEMSIPGMDVRTFCYALRASPSPWGSYIMLICNSADEDKLAQTVDAGADDFLLRPITALTLFARLRVADRIIHLQSEVLRERNALAQTATEWAGSNRRLTLVAMTDLLTRLPNRRHGLDFLAAEWALAHGNNLPMACLMIDIDHFKSINDKFGHEIGDAVLAALANRLKTSARSEDMVFRYGGEEFCVVCPGTNQQKALEIAERIRKNVAAMSIHNGDLGTSVTISIGVAAVSPPYDKSDETLIHDADAALFRAKQQGRNRVEMAD